LVDGLNIIAGVVYTLMIVAVVSVATGWYFYTMFGLIEIVLSLLVVWYAWSWPKEGKPPARLLDANTARNSQAISAAQL
jgi:hypothetical protein